jgi:hypothetical protein
MRTPDNLPCSSSISIQSCPSLPNIQLILFPHLPPTLPLPCSLTNPCISYYSSPCTILRVVEGVRAITHFQAIVIVLCMHPMFPIGLQFMIRNIPVLAKSLCVALKMYLEDVMFRITGFLDFFPLSGILETRKHDVSETWFLSVLRWGEKTPIQLGHLKRAYLDHCTQLSRCLPPSPEDGNRSSFRNIVFSSL